jgi:quinol monooxygenase YgiN
MFALVEECQAKDGRGVQISAKVTNDVLPILQEQPGSVDFLALSDDTNAERLVCISFWASPEDAEEYHRQHYETITGMLKPVLESPPHPEDLHRQCLNSASHCDSPSCLRENPGTLGFASAPGFL